jgi:hypothetical protein
MTGTQKTVVILAPFLLSFLAWLIRFLYRVWRDKKDRQPCLRLLEAPSYQDNGFLVDAAGGRTAFYFSSELHNNGKVSVSLTGYNIECVEPSGKKHIVKPAHARPLLSEALESLRSHPAHIFRPPTLVRVDGPPVKAQFLGIVHQCLPLAEDYVVSIRLTGPVYKGPWERYTVSCREPTPNPIDSITF